MLSEMGIQVTEEEETEEEDAEKKGSTAVVETSTSREVAVATTETEKLDRTDDPVRMYLREMGSVELLSREGEIAIAKRIEAGRNTMIAGLCESPLTFQAITIWRDEPGLRTSSTGWVTGCWASSVRATRAFAPPPNPWTSARASVAWASGWNPPNVDTG